MISELEKTVSLLESGDASLEESLDLFEKGTRLLRELARILEEAERKVEVLTKDASGSLSTGPFQEEEEE
ncbi:MAG: exodeoxyribonuclease VII small subunit [bacterium]|nr:MAG: exodeoxyribonuclease VII small subunit [bacterium]